MNANIVNLDVLGVTLKGRGETNSRAFYALIGYRILLGEKGTVIAKAYSIDPGDVSRIGKLAKALPTKGATKAAKARRELLAVSWADVSAERGTALVDAAALGALFARTGKQAAGSKQSAGAKPLPAPTSGNVRVSGDDGKATDRDVREVYFEWLIADYSVRLPLTEAMLANAEAYVAEQAAEEDAA